MKYLIALLLPLALSLPARGELLARVVDLPLDPAWQAVDPREPGQPTPPLPTLKYEPKNGSRAALLVSLLPARGAGTSITDLASLKELNLMTAAPFLPSPDAKPEPTELTIAEGIGVYLSNEDPALKDKPTPPGEYRMATSATLLLGKKYVLICTIMHEKVDSDEFRQALAMIGAAKMLAVDTSVVRHPKLRTVLHLPPGRYEPSAMQARSDPGYFIFADRNGITMSGWLDRAERFDDMKSFWAVERASLVERAGFEISNEEFQQMGEWSVVCYTVKLGPVNQKNLRACRVVDDAWADIHISKTGDNVDWQDLKAALAELSLKTE